uniref:Peroxisomal membrane protein PEX14 n=1 Tax=Fagus sylvatica TaxID=28930 RepID=A0A2N9IXK3_FAGSY
MQETILSVLSDKKKSEEGKEEEELELVSHLLDLALAEKLDDLNRVAAVVSRLGKKCSEPALQGWTSEAIIKHSVTDPGTNYAVCSSCSSQYHFLSAVPISLVSCCFAVGILAVSGAGTAVLIKNSIVPRLKSWIRKVVLEEENDLVKKIDSKPSLAEEAAAAAKAAAAAAADVAKASQEMLNSRNEGGFILDL